MQLGSGRYTSYELNREPARPPKQVIQPEGAGRRDRTTEITAILRHQGSMSRQELADKIGLGPSGTVKMVENLARTFPFPGKAGRGSSGRCSFSWPFGNSIFRKLGPERSEVTPGEIVSAAEGFQAFGAVVNEPGTSGSDPGNPRLSRRLGGGRVHQTYRSRYPRRLHAPRSRPSGACRKDRYSGRQDPRVSGARQEKEG